ncbi:MAG TPA: NnrU family protein, partial [Arenicellales bacterium]|nr:NnrU family protein [Arenicellales bacterium]
MTLLIAGVLLWSLVHLLPIAARGLRQRLVSRLGLGAYSGLFALTILLAVVLIVLGWMSASATEVYEPPNWGWHLNILLMLFSLLLFTASSMK